MSAKVMGMVFDLKRLTPTVRLVLLALADHASHDGRKAFPGQTLLQEKTELSERTVRRALRELEAKGLIVMVRPPAHHSAAEYDLPWVRAVIVTALNSEGPNPERSTATVRAVNGDSHVDVLSTEPSVEPSRTSRTLAADDKPRRSAAARFSENRFIVPDPLMTLWKEAYPAVDLPVEIAAAAAWAVAHPENRKSNWTGFLVRWLKKAQDRAPAKGSSMAPTDPPKRKEYTAEELAWANRLLSREGR